MKTAETTALKHAVSLGDLFNETPHQIVRQRINSANSFGHGNRAKRRCSQIVWQSVGQNSFGPQFDRLNRVSGGA